MTYLDALLHDALDTYHVIFVTAMMDNGIYFSCKTASESYVERKGERKESTGDERGENREEQKGGEGGKRGEQIGGRKGKRRKMKVEERRGNGECALYHNESY